MPAHNTGAGVRTANDAADWHGDSSSRRRRCVRKHYDANGPALLLRQRSMPTVLRPRSLPKHLRIALHGPTWDGAQEPAMLDMPPGSGATHLLRPPGVGARWNTLSSQPAKSLGACRLAAHGANRQRRSLTLAVTFGTLLLSSTRVGAIASPAVLHTGVLVKTAVPLGIVVHPVG